jgi:hypothetical protein
MTRLYAAFPKNRRRYIETVPTVGHRFSAFLLSRRSKTVSTVV